jgi:hypothetical protein
LFIEGQAKKSHLLTTAIVDVQNSSGQTPAVTTSRDTQHISAMRRQQSEYNLNRFWEVEPVEQSSMTTEQTCEKHFLSLTHTHTQPNSQMEYLWLGFQSRSNRINWQLLKSLQSKDHMQLNAGWKEIQN